MAKRDEAKLYIMERHAAIIGNLIGGAFDDMNEAEPDALRACFALLAFTVEDNPADDPDQGWMTWVSNADRSDMIKALREMADKLEAEMDLPPGSTHRPQ